MDSTTFKIAPFGLRSTGLYFLRSCSTGYLGWSWMPVEFPVPLLTLLQLQSYLVPFISARIFIILKLQNIHLGQFYTITLSYGEPFSLCIEGLSNCYSVRSGEYSIRRRSDWAFRNHISLALPTETIFYLLRSIRSEFLICNYFGEDVLYLDTLEMIINWLQVSVSECNLRTSQTKYPI